MTYLEAAEKVLRAAKRPLSAREITEIALREGLITSHGKTPEATMSARLYVASAEGRFQRQCEPGPNRARRGSVRWLLGAGGDARSPAP
jgi:HB1, ASXL, restriction endonuclease HTH domain